MGAMKDLYTDLCLGLEQASVNLHKAAESGDVELMEAVLVNTLDCLPSYLEAIQGVK
jgi:hypothetical protein